MTANKINIIPLASNPTETLKKAHLKTDEPVKLECAYFR